jgi:hypothetical protein
MSQKLSASSGFKDKPVRIAQNLEPTWRMARKQAMDWVDRVDTLAFPKGKLSDLGNW